MRIIRALSTAVAVAAVAAGCSSEPHDTIKGRDQALGTICVDTGADSDEILTGVNFVVMGANSGDLTIAEVTLVKPQNIELRDSYIVRDGSFDTATMAPEDIDAGDHEFEPAQGAVLEPDEVDFSVVVDVKATDRSTTATFEAVRVTYADAQGSTRSVDGVMDFSFEPNCD